MHVYRNRRYEEEIVLLIFAQTMESATNNPQFALSNLQVDVSSTTSLWSNVPAVYGAWHMFTITEELFLDEGKSQRQDAEFLSSLVLLSYAILALLFPLHT
jgi:hypothetical protein